MNSRIRSLLLSGPLFVTMLFPAAQAQQLAERRSMMAAIVPSQAKIAADGVVAFGIGGAQVVRARVYHIVTPQATDRVRLSVRVVGDANGTLRWRAVSAADDVRRPIGTEWMLVATSDPDAGEFSSTVEFSCAAAIGVSGPCRAVLLDWKFEILTQ